MTPEEKRIIVETFKDCANVATANALTYVEKAFESVVELQIPITKEVNGKLETEGYREPTAKELCACIIMFLKDGIKNVERDLHEKHKD